MHKYLSNPRERQSVGIRIPTRTLQSILDCLMYQLSTGTLEALSRSIGGCSLIIWLCAQIPQIVKNHRRKCVDGISPQFLLAWILGDVSGLLGCIITKQLLFQTLLATYYCIIDTVLIAQFFMYRTTIEYIDGCEFNADSTDNTNRITRKGRKSSAFKDSVLSAMKVGSFAAGLKSVSAAPVDMILNETHNLQSVFSTALALSASAGLYLGRGMGYFSTFMYLISRMPQIAHNFQRKSTTGISMLLFVSTFAGNLTYTLSILLSPECLGENANTRQFLNNEMSYLIGSMGTMLFDVVILLQWRYYNMNKHLRRRSTAFADKLSRPYFGTTAEQHRHIHNSIRPISIPPLAENNDSTTAGNMMETQPILTVSPRRSYGSVTSSCISSIQSL